ncbi:MAG: hypothetical protein WBP79_14890 [Candidatus Acidiferrales bacterium]
MNSFTHIRNPKYFSSMFRLAAKPIVICLVAVLIAVVCAWAGGDPWKSKPFQQWDEKDVNRILTDSPWAKIVRVAAPWKGSKVQADDADDSGGMKSGGRDPVAPGAVGAGIADQGGPQVAQAAFLIRWISSRTVREAAFRNAVLAGQMKEEDAEKQLGQPVEVFQVFVGGPDMRPFDALDEKSIKEGAFLLSKKTKQKTVSTGLQISRSPDGKKIRAIAFSFPKKSASGESTIAADEKSVEFNFVIGTTKIQNNFELSKMEDSAGRDL